MVLGAVHQLRNAERDEMRYETLWRGVGGGGG